jgi:predicted nucleic acid-binding protein
VPAFNPTTQVLRELIPESYELAESLSRSFYDALFVRIAQHLGFELVTADEPLFAAASALSLPVVWLGSFESV